MADGEEKRKKRRAVFHIAGFPLPTEGREREEPADKKPEQLTKATSRLPK